MVHDVTGHYQRFDVFSLQVNRQAYPRKLVGPLAEQQAVPLGVDEETEESAPLVQDPHLVTKS